MRNGGGSEYWKWSGLGLEFAGILVLFTLLGHWAGKRWDWQPWGELVGIGLGLVGGFYWLIRESIAMSKDLCPPKKPESDKPDRERRG